MERVIVIGGGASGLMAALSAAEDRDREVLLLERQQRVGRKLLATGNGRCNLTNTEASPARYHGAERDFAGPALARFGPREALDFFHGLGLLTVEEHGGRVYPLSNSANSVLDVLRFALERSGASLRTACPALRAERTAGGFLVHTETERLFAHKLILACGGLAGERLGGVSDGYRLAAALGHSRTPLSPALVPITTEPEYPRALKGVRVQGTLGLWRQERCLGESRGEIQFTETGVSGPAAFDLSRPAAAEGPGLSLRLCLLPGTAEERLALVSARCRCFPERETADCFTGMLPNRMGRMLVRYSGLDAARPLGTLSPAEQERLAGAAGDFRLAVRGTQGFDKAQVTAGGLSTREVEARTLESRLVPGLYLCGELLDVDGDCGGFNLQWAWSSGYVAGRLGR